MNPILKNRRNLTAYSVAVALFAWVYSLMFGLPSRIGGLCIAVDAIIYGFLFGVQGIVVWNIFRYVIAQNEAKGVRVFMSAAMWVMVVGSIVGLESLTLYGCMDDFSVFAVTLPQRIVVTVMAMSILVLLYRNDLTRRESAQAAAERIPATPAQSDVLERITVKGGQKIKVIALDDVEYLQAEGDYVGIVTADGKWLKEQTMKFFEEHLPATRFARIHRSYIVNTGKIARIERYGSQYQVILRSGEKIKVSVNGYRTLKQQLEL